MKKLMSIFACLFLVVGIAMAQSTQRIAGQVVSAESGQPIMGANVFVNGTPYGTTTNAKGEFSIPNLPEKYKTVSVSFFGMETQNVPVSAKMLVKLRENSKVLDEAIVVAFGTATKETFTGSVSVIGEDEIAKSQSTNVLESMNGKVAGVQMTNASGQPGQASPSIRVRGISSINAGNAPLVILDGAPYEGDLNNINPQDIESYSVLKDAASCAQYGARGANGIIMITTKKAKKNENAKLTVDAKWGANSRSTQRYNTINNPALYYETYYNFLKNNALYQGMSEEEAYMWANANLIDGSNGLKYNIYNVPEGQYMIGRDGKLNPNATMGNVVGGNYLTADDWVDEVYKTGFRQEYNVSATNATDKTNFLASFGYLSNGGIVPNSDYERITGRLKADTQLKDWVRLGGNMSFTHYSMNSMDEDGASNSSGNIFAAANQVAPIYPLYIRDAKGNVLRDVYGNPRYDYGDKTQGGLERPVYTKSNAVSSAILDDNSNEGNAMTAFGFAEFKYKDFKFTSNNTVGLDESRSTSVTNPFYGSYASSNGIVSKEHDRSLSTNYEQFLEWAHTFDKHSLNALLAHTWYRRDSYVLYASKKNMFDPSNHELNGAVTDGSMGSYTNYYNQEAWMGRVQYNYDEKYFGMLTYRCDGSSNFKAGNRWGSFWSGSAAWLLSKEDFIKQYSWIDLLKLKASYGENGNDNIGSFRYVNTYTVKNSVGQPSVVPEAKGNEDISWEKQQNFDVGVEFELFKSRLNGSVNFFSRKTADMLLWFPMPASFGYTGYYDNVGDMRNTGFEISLDAEPVRWKDLVWKLNANITFFKNKITYLPEERKGQTVNGVRGYSSGDKYYGQGKSIYTYYMYKWAGVNEQGMPMWYLNKKDADGKYMTTTNYADLGADDHFLCGTALPTAYGGFGTSIAFKGFDASIDFGYQIGGKVYDSDYASMMGTPNTNSRGSAFHSDLLKAWSATNTNTNVPALIYGSKSSVPTYYSASSSSRFLTNASYLSINNINIGYTLPVTLTSKFGISNLRVYCAAENVAIWSKRQGLDPRQSLSGSTTNSYYAPMRTISGGLTITF